MLCAVNINDSKLRDLCNQTQVVLLPWHNKTLLIKRWTACVLGFDMSAFLHIVYRCANGLDSREKYQHHVLKAGQKVMLTMQ